MIGIRNMDMPKTCAECQFGYITYRNNRKCKISESCYGVIFTSKERPTDCPLVEIEKDGWIPCSERLPEEGKQVLVSGYNTYGKEVTIASYQGEQYGWTCGLVSAWQPLPSPYEKEIKTS